MCYQLTQSALITIGKQCYLSPYCRLSSARRQLRLRLLENTRTFASTSNKAPKPRLGNETSSNTQGQVGSSLPADSLDSSGTLKPAKNVAILGGGITGLASAYYLSKELPSATVTLYESAERLGGWLNSKHINVGDGTVIFEQGPRTIRPGTLAGRLTVDLVQKLGLEDEIIITDKNSVAARNRYIYYPDHLVQLPNSSSSVLSSIYALFTEPIFEGQLLGFLTELRTNWRGRGLEDESVGSFLQRRTGNTHIADNLASAILHGIYAGDVYQLSMKSLFPIFPLYESIYGSITRGLVQSISSRSRIVPARDKQLLREFPASSNRLAGLHSASVYSFKKGISQLSRALVRSLKKNPKIRIRTSETIREIYLDQTSNKVELSTSLNQPPTKFDHVISTIPSRALSYLTKNPTDLPSLQGIHAVTVMVVNLFYTNPSLLPVHGFGYLIPRSVPWEQNPERALGVIFDSDASVGQDTAAGTKVTVMLGGHWWDDFVSYPDEEEGAMMAKAILKRHLKIEDEPAVVNVSLQKDCIPQYTVGHRARLGKAHNELLKGFQGRLTVAGNSYTGVGLNDCVRAARDVVKAVKAHEYGVTGLEQFTGESKWISIPRV